LHQLTIENAETLAYLANQGCIAIHVWPSRVDDIYHPDRMVFDFDPSSAEDFDSVRKGARMVREVLKEAGFSAWVMTTGSRGLHVVSPLKGDADFDTVHRYAARIARHVAGREKKRFTVEQRKNKRGSRVFIDYLRNVYAQHSIAPYSVRAKPGAPVAMPLLWDEVQDPRLKSDKYTIVNALRRLSRKDDPWKDIAGHAASLRELQSRLEDLLAEEDVA
jgi:bifunctional non-homologous end joining protein LigD